MDVDIDFADRDLVLSKINYHYASLKDGKKHNTGIYVTEIPHNPLTNVSTINYKDAEERGYFKIDFLNVNIYKGVKNEEHLFQLMDTEPLWELLEYPEFVDQVFHINGHCGILQKLKPKNIEQLAAVLAIIRPAKKHLIDEPWEIIHQQVWQPPTNGGYYFKRSHGFAYAMAVIVHMNLLCENFMNEAS